MSIVQTWCVERQSRHIVSTTQHITANTGEIFEGPKHYGHTYGHENRRILKEAEARGMTQKELNDLVHSHHEWFQIEKPENNLHHRFEKPGSN